MVCYEYLREGEWLGYQYYTPDIVVTIPKADGGQVNFVLEVDSGAAITLLPYSASVMLDIDLKSGEPVQLGGVGGSVFICYVHKLALVIGGVEYTDIPVAIAPTNDFPPLLGRLGLYDVADVLMDNADKAVCIGAVDVPLPSPSSFIWPWELEAYVVPVALIAGVFMVVMMVK